MNEDIWTARGIAEAGHARCDEAMALMLRAVALAGPELANVVFAEAKYQAFELPKRSAEFQEEQRWQPPKDSA
jgi:hypothetical protein